MKLLPRFFIFAMISLAVHAQEDVQIHPDLRSKEIVDVNSIRTDFQQKIDEIKQNVNQNNVMDVGVPDYKPASYALQSKISKSLMNFFKRLDAINIAIKQDLSRVYSVQQSAEKYNDPMWDRAYTDEIARVYPRINNVLTSIYPNAIKDLYTLDGYLNLPVRSGKNKQQDIFKEWKAEKPTYLEMCSTKLCVHHIARDITEWMELVDSINNNIEFKQRSRINLSTSAIESQRINHFATGVNDFMKKMIEFNLESNRTYDNGSAALDYLQNVAQSGVGLAAGIAYLPALVLDKAVQFSKRVKGTRKFIFTELKASRLDTFDIPKAVNDFETLSLKEIDKSSMKSVAIGEEEIKTVLVASLMKHFPEKEFIIQAALHDDPDFKGLIKKYFPRYFSYEVPDRETLISLNRHGRCIIKRTPSGHKYYLSVDIDGINKAGFDYNYDFNYIKNWLKDKNKNENFGCLL